ncbi:ATP-binding protein [Flavobacterium sp. B183]|uniref:AAA family ATPase n=1 Tax=Flavobacterium sp. B183 TaxID=907046 RepID=UPI00201EA6AF|nr:ATP-binding protein [Flavobacterium sp. B183]URC14809.1 ATP-binding protein [Flavobacterium sp. B183]
MPLVTYEQPFVAALLDENKPMSPANKSFPYNQIADPRRFEQLLYSLYSIRIGESNFEKFDNISLMSGVSEKGRDCALFTCGKSTGLIQCKKHSSNLSIAAFGEEITKFVLYSLLEPTLIDDPDNFTYYIAVSSGFVSACSDFIDNFNQKVIQEQQELQNWITSNLKKPTLQDLKPQQNSLLSTLLDIFSRIKVKKIGPSDLDSLLTLPSCCHLINSFFEVRTVLNEQASEKVINYLDRTLDEPKIKAALKKSSAALSLEKNHLEEVADSHIERNETQALLNWITEDCTRDDKGRHLNICLLAGNAGMGKTVILKDLYDQLIEDGIPVMGLKADRLVSASIVELQHKIGLAVPMLDFIEQCKEKYPKTVILIDQIDALSQAMSADRNYLRVFKNIIDSYTYDTNIRIVISVRIFDLHYDPSLRIYKHLKTVNTELFTEEQVKSLLDKASIIYTGLSNKLLQLLRTPNHINIFTRLPSAVKSGNSIKNLQDLYAELYKLKVLSVDASVPVQPAELKKVLFKIAAKMFDSQSITVSELQFEDYKKQLNYLESERLIKIEDAQIQFFHETFYDFIFAKRFVEKSLSLYKYIHKEDQSIFIRSAVKMIFNYLRQYAPDIFIDELRKIFCDKKILFHIKQLCFSLLLFLEDVNTEEKTLASKIMLENTDFELLFFEHSRSEKWLELALEKNIINSFLNALKQTDSTKINEERNKIYQHYVSDFLQSYLEKNNADAWAYILKLNNSYIKETILSRLKNWKDHNAFKLLEQCTDFYKNDPFGYFLAMDKIAEINPEYCLKILKERFLRKEWMETARQTDHQEKKVFKTLSKLIPEKIIDLLLPILIRELEANKHSNSELYDDYFYSDVNLKSDNELHDKGYYYWLLARCLCQTAKKHDSMFLRFAQEHRNSEFEAVLRLLVHALSGSENTYLDEIFKLFKHFYNIKRFMTSSDLGVEYRELLQKSLPLFSQIQLKEITAMIKSLKIPAEAAVYRDRTKYLNIGHTKHVLLQRFPDEMIEQNKELRILRLELNRKFKPYKETYRSHNLLAGVVHRPLTDIAYERMSAVQWLKSFKKYNSEREPFQGDSRKGGLYEHVRAFKDFAKKYPTQEKAQIIEKVIQDGEINLEYALYGLEGLCEAEFDAEKIHQLFKKILPSREKFLDKYSFLNIAYYLLKSNIEDAEILDYVILTGKAVEGKKIDYSKYAETSTRGLLTAGINTIYGRAAKNLIFLQIDKYEDLIFPAVQDMLQNGPDEQKATIVHYFAYLNKINRERSFNIFSDHLKKEDNVYVLASAIWSMQYMGNHDFKKLVPIYRKLISCNSLGKEDSRWLFSILHLSYLLQKEGAEELLFNLIAVNSSAGSSSFNLIFEHFYFNEESPDRSNKVLMYILEADKADPDEKLQIFYSEFETLKLDDISEFLAHYIKSPKFQFSGSLVRYLTWQCSHNPVLCINLFNMAVESDNHNLHRDRGYQRDHETTRFIIGAFNSLKESGKESKKLRKQLLQSFDKLLRDYNSRKTSEKVLEELI